MPANRRWISPNQGQITILRGPNPQGDYSDALSDYQIYFKIKCYLNFLKIKETQLSSNCFPPENHFTGFFFFWISISFKNNFWEVLLCCWFTEFILSLSIAGCIQFYWHTATSIHLCFIHDCLPTTVAELNSYNRNLWPTKPKIFTIWIYIEKISQFFIYRVIQHR